MQERRREDGATASQGKPRAGTPSGDRAVHGPSSEQAVAKAIGSAPTAVAGAAAESGSWIGRVIDERYRVTEVLGEGGMGAVFVAEHLKLRKDVALKVIRAELAGNGEVAARFAREAMATAQFEHPHVASAIDYGTLPEGGAYFVMQLVRGRSLRSLLDDEGPIPWQRACALLSQVADALSAARAARIVHRDLKPDNMLVEAREDGSELVKVLDFGIARVTPSIAPAPEGAEINRTLTRVGTVMGTPGYMAPEQCVGEQVDHRTDLYALGVVLWECVAGRPLWEGDDITTIMGRQLSEMVPPLRELVPDATLPQALDDLVQRLTARAPADRPEHAGGVRDALRELPTIAAFERARTDNEPGWRRSLDAMGRQPWRYWLGAWKRLPARGRLLATTGAVGMLALVVLLALALAREGGDGERSTLGEVVVKATKILAPAKPTLPDTLKRTIETMQESRAIAERKAAADVVLAFEHRDWLKPHIVKLAELESARSCTTRREVILAMAAKPDRRYLPALQRVRGWRKSGCGFLSLEDCHSCLRDDLAVTIGVIEATPSAAIP